MRISIIFFGFFLYINASAQLCIEGDCEDINGIMINADGSKYTGSFANGKPHGQGALDYRNGDKYEGSFSEGLSHGYGTYSWSNGDFYEGEFYQGMKHGKGRIKYSEGEEYAGQFANDLPHGNGSCLIRSLGRIDTFSVGLADKREYKNVSCSWIEGKLIE
tara:strand:+ start:5228 stop:5710 length:483 start_codon:yes stop_codon:yes gene_type:complete